LWVGKIFSVETRVHRAGGARETPLLVGLAALPEIEPESIF
jgi:hypothetical protein